MSLAPCPNRSMRQLRAPLDARVVFLSVACLVVLFQQIDAEITFKISPHGVNVIRVVLRVVVLDEERGSLNTIVVGPTALLHPGPGEVEIVPRLFDLSEPCLRNLI